jgi:hypothetical protein
MPCPIVVVNQQANGTLYNAQDPDVPILEATPLEFGDWQSSRGFISTNMYLPPFEISDERMSTVFSSATSTFKCMTNFGLTQWLLGASSAVFPGALPTVDATQATIIQYIKDSQKSPFVKFALSAVSKIAPSLAEVLKNGGDLSAAYQDLGKQGLLTANVHSNYQHG